VAIFYLGYFYLSASGGHIFARFDIVFAADNVFQRRLIS